MLGTSLIARRFAEDLGAVPMADLVAVASRSLGRARGFASRVGGARAYGSYGELARDPAVDVVYVATPEARHRDDCVMCLEAGKAVLCEKPFTVTADQARQVVAAARARKLFCMEAMWMRFVPVMAELKRVVDAGCIGSVNYLLADFAYPTEIQPSHRLFNAALGGGALLDRGVYPLSLAFWLLGRPVEVMSRSQLGQTGVDEICAILLSFSGDRFAMLSASLRGHGANEAVIVGSEGRIRVHSPLCRPDKLTIEREPILRLRQEPQVRNSLALRAARRAVRAARGWLPCCKCDSRIVRLPAKRHGLRYEAMEVMQCLGAGRLESSTMPLDETVALMETIDQIRGQWTR